MAQLQGSGFITQPQTINDYQSDEIGELEALVSGVTQTSQSTLLLKKRKEMREVDDALDFMKEEFAHRMNACEERQRDFQRKQNDMKEQVTKFEKFIQENDAKRSRADMKAKGERKACEKHEVDLKKKLLGLDKDRSVKQEKDSELEKLKKYRYYLESTVEACEDDEYEEIADVLNRFSTLKDANDDLQELVTKGELEMDNLRGELLQLKRETQNQVLVHNSEIHGYQKEVEYLRTEASRLTSQREDRERKMNDRSRESGQVVMSIKNLYTRCCTKTKVPHIEEKETLPHMQACLKFIAERICDLKEITSGAEILGKDGKDSSVKKHLKN